MTNENTQGNIKKGRKLEITKETRSIENQSCQSKASISEKAKARFWKKVIKSNSEHCWSWIGAKTKFGHGKILHLGKYETASRMSWLIHNGFIPEKICVCHKCDNPSCVNPNHLFLGTHKENMEDAKRKGRMHFQTHPEHSKRCGEMHRNCKLTKNDIIEIRSLNGTISQTEMAKKYGVLQGSISNIIAGRSWKHLLNTK